MIEHAEQQVVLVTPGISVEVANAIGRRLDVSGDVLVTVVLDADPEAFRLGLGTIEGLRAMQTHAERHHLALQSQPGIRIGVLISDDTTLVFAPTPKLVEAGSTTPEKPNAIVLGGDAAHRVALAAGAPGSTGAETCGKPEAAQSIEVGERGLTPAEVRRAEDDLKRNPPQPFDLARRARVFSSKVQYVELEVSNYQVQQKEVTIPPDLLGLRDGGELRDRWRNSLRVLDAEFARAEVCLDASVPEQLTLVTPEFIRRRRTQLEKKYLFKVRGHGTMILRANQLQFEEDVRKFEALVIGFIHALRTKWQAHRDTLAKRLCDTLLPQVLGQVPDRYKKFNPFLSEDDIRQHLLNDLTKALDDDKVLEDPKVRLVFKGVTPESLRSGNFMQELAAAVQRDGMPKEAIGGLFTEADAVLEADRASPAT